MRVSPGLAGASKQATERVPAARTHPPVPASVRTRVRDALAAIETDLAANGRPPVLGAELDAVLSRARIMGRPTSTWQDAANLLGAMRRLHAGMRAQNFMGIRLVSDNDPKLLSLAEGMRDLVSEAAAAGVTLR